MKRNVLLLLVVLTIPLALAGCIRGIDGILFPEKSAPTPDIPGSQVSSAQVVQDQFIVVLKAGVNSQVAAQDIAARMQGRVLHVYSTALLGFALKVPQAAVPSIERDPRVRAVEPDRVFTIIAQTLPTGIDRIETERNPNADIDQSDDVRLDYDVAIIDTGIDGDHPDLNVAGGRNFAGGPSNKWDDGNGHGSHVAGAVGALDNGSGVVGVAPGLRLWAVKVCNNGGLCKTSDMIAGIDWAAARKAEANDGDADGDPGINFASANMSISTPDETNTCSGGEVGALHEAVCGLVSQGVVFSLAAGNDNRVKDAFPEVLAVSALADFDGKAGGVASPTCRSDEDDTLANFSNFGPEVDIAAPGVCIRSTWNDGGYNTISGTSMAAPHVAGAVALYLHSNSRAPATDVAGVDAIEQAIIDAALPEGTVNQECSYDNEFGSSEPLLFVNAAAFGGDGSCEVADSKGDPPTVSWVNPLDADTVSGTVDIQIDASDSEDAAGTLTIEWRVDGGTWQSTTFSSTTGYYEASWNTTSVADGDHTLDARATDSDGNTSTASITVTVDNGGTSGGGMYVWEMAWSEKHRGPGGSFTDLSVTVDINQDDGNGTAESTDDPAKNATVTLVLTHDTDGDGNYEPGTDDDSWSFQGDTNGKGQITFTLKFAPDGNYQAEVTDLTHSTLTWNSTLDADNPDWYCGVPNGSEC